MANPEDARRELQQHLEKGGTLEGSASSPTTTAKAIATMATALSFIGAPAASTPATPVVPASTLNASFTEAAQKRAEDVYRGREGYNRMVNEIRDSLYREIPEARGHIDIVNHLTDAHDEMTRLQSSLGIDGETLSEKLELKADGKNLNGGEAFPRHLDDGRYVCVASAWDPDTANENIDKMTFDDIKSHARIIAHETMHCLDPGHQDASLGEGILNSDEITYAAHFRKSEMFADLGANALMLNNGEKAGGTLAMAMNYNTEAASRTKNSTHFGYDNGPVFLKLTGQYDDTKQPGITDFNFTHWRQTMAQVGNLRTHAESITNTAIAQDLYQSYALDEAQQKFIDAAIKNSPYPDDKEFRGNVEYLFNKSDFEPLEKPVPGEKIDITIKTANEARTQYNIWVRDRSDILPAAARITASYDWVKNGGTGPIPPEATQNNRMDLDIVVGRTALKYQQSGSELDKSLFDAMVRSAEAQTNIDIIVTNGERSGWVDNTKQYYRLLNDPVAAKRLADGEPRDDVFKSLSPEAPKQSSDASVQKPAPQPAASAPSL